MALIALECRGCQWLVGRRSGGGAVALHHPVTWCSRVAGNGEAGTPSLTPPPCLGWKRAKALQPNMVNEQAGGCQRMAWPCARQKLLCYTSPDTGGIQDDCSNTQPSLLPYPQLLFYQMEKACTQGTHFKRFLSPPKVTRRDFHLLLIGLIKAAFFPFSSLELSLP